MGREPSITTVDGTRNRKQRNDLCRSNASIVILSLASWWEGYAYLTMTRDPGQTTVICVIWKKESLTASSQIELGQVSDEGQSESESHVKPKHNTRDSRVAGAPATLLKPDTMRARMRY